MKVKLSEIQANPNGVTVEVSYQKPWLFSILGEELAIRDNLPKDSQEESFALSCFLQMNHEEVLVRGNATIFLALRCSRCVTAALQDLSFSFDLLFAPRQKMPKSQKGKEIKLEESDLDIDFFDGDELDLEQIAQEQLLLALPSYPACQENCLGLCKQCGNDLNKIICDCKPIESIDPRLAKLANIQLSDPEGGQKS